MTSNLELDIYQKIGKALKDIRQEKKLTLQQIEKMSDQYAPRISKVENGKLNLSLGWIIHYCNVLDINPSEVFTELLQKILNHSNLKISLRNLKHILHKTLKIKRPLIIGGCFFDAK